MSQAPLNRYKNRRLSGKNSVSIDVDLDRALNLIDQIVDDMQAATKPAAAAGAKVIYDQVKVNVRALGRVTGNLESSIYRTLSEDQSNDTQTTYHISWNHIKAPHGHLVEFGYLRRYRVRLNNKGQWVTLVRPEKIGTPRPKRKDSRAVKDAYYFPLATPVHVPGTAFLANAVRAQPQAIQAVEQVLVDQLTRSGFYGA